MPLEKHRANGWFQGSQDFQGTAAFNGTMASPSKFVSKIEGIARGEIPFSSTFPSTTSKQLEIPNVFIDYKRYLELDVSLHTQK